MLLVPGLLLVRGLDIGSPRACLTLAWVLLLGLVATQSIGAMLGSLISTPRGAGYLSIPVLGLVAISGIFYPVTSMPPWLQWTAQVFPMYWLGLGMRSALLPASAVSAEIGHSWRYLDTAGVPGGLGRDRPGPGASRAPPDGAPGVGLERGRAPREGPAADRVSRTAGASPGRYEVSTSVRGAATSSRDLPSALIPNAISTSPPMIMMPPPTMYPMVSPVRLVPLPISTP
jgi:hypothetical protein